MSTVLLDLNHLGLPGAIGSYLVAGSEPTLVDPGPATTLDVLVERLRREGVGEGDLGHIALTHVHLDHAGATGHLARLFPRARIHVHAEGAPHLVDPTRLVASTRRTFGEAHDRLWGDVQPVPADRITAWSPGDGALWADFRPVPTPGHIAHHLAYLDERDGTLFAGDAMGIVLSAEAPSHPPTPPPAVDLEAWRETLEEVRAIGPERFAATHFGLHEDVPARVEALGEALDGLKKRVADALARGDEEDAGRYGEEVARRMAPFLGSDRAERYFGTFSAAMDWEGVRFYLQRRARSRKDTESDR